MVVDLIVNPASGTASRGLPRHERVRLVSDLLRAGGASLGRTTETRGGDDARRAAQEAITGGAERVFVWGGDGTLNEVAGALAGTAIPMAIIAGGSGNGFALSLGLTRDVRAAIATCLTGRVRSVDVGAVGDRTFINLAGVGFDAVVASRVNTANRRRGLLPYVQRGLGEFRRYEATTFTLTLDDELPRTVHGHMVVVCNGSRYGPGAWIAPDARIDDGWLDVVALPRVSVPMLLRHGWRLFAGTLPRVPGVFTGRARRVVVTQERALPAHLDGEVIADTTTRVFDVRPRALQVLVPTDSDD